jgi:putative transposase
MHKSSIAIWKPRFLTSGLEGIKLGYQGGKSYLTAEQRDEIINWLSQKTYWDFDELVNYLAAEYEVIYQSRQSYYELLAAAGISWKKSQKINPNFNPELVEKKREEIKEFLNRHRAEIDAGSLIVFFLDECHLLGDDGCGYVWGQI